MFDILWVYLIAIGLCASTSLWCTMWMLILSEPPWDEEDKAGIRYFIRFGYRSPLWPYYLCTGVVAGIKYCFKTIKEAYRA